MSAIEDIPAASSAHFTELRLNWYSQQVHGIIFLTQIR